MAEWVAEAIANGRIVDLVIAITVLEALALLLYRAVTGKGIAARQFLVNLLSGLSLMAALRLTIASTGWVWVAVCLLLSGLLHVADLWQRWER